MKELKTPYEITDSSNDEEKHDRREIELGKLVAWMVSPNLINDLEGDDTNKVRLLEKWGADVCKGYKNDLESGAEKAAQVYKTEKLAKLQSLKPDPDFPFPDAAQAVNPLVSKAVTQSFIREFGMLMKGQNIVKFNVKGKDPEGVKAEKAEKAGAFLSYYILYVMDDWLINHINALMSKPCSGAVYKKNYYDASKKRVVNALIRASNYIMDNFTVSLDTCNRATHVYTLYPYEMESKFRSGDFVEINLSAGDGARDEDAGSAVDSQEGNQSSSGFLSGSINSGGDDPDAPYIILEQATRLDLDKDGSTEPYILVVEKASQKVVKIFANFDPSTIYIKVPPLEKEDKSKGDLLSLEAPPTDRIITLEEYLKEEEAAGRKPKNSDRVFVAKIKKLESVTQMLHMPSVDGSINGQGQEILATTNELINDVTNMLLDSGTLANLKGGLITEDVQPIDGSDKIESTMNEYTTVRVIDGQPLGNHVMHYPKIEPSIVLYQLLIELTRQGDEQAGATNLMSGGMPKGNTPVGTVLALLEQGSKRHSATTELSYIGMSKEFTLIWNLIKKHPPENMGFINSEGSWEEFSMEDMDDDGLYDIVPVADRGDISNAHKLMKATLLREVVKEIADAGGNPGEVLRRYLEAIQTSDIEQLLPTDAKPPESIEMIQAKQEVDKVSLESMNAGKDFELESKKLEQEFTLAMRKQEMENQRIQNEIFQGTAEMKKNLASAAKDIASAESMEPGDQQYRLQVETDMQQYNQNYKKLAAHKDGQIQKQKAEIERLKASVAPAQAPVQPPQGTNLPQPGGGMPQQPMNPGEEPMQ